MAQPVAADFLGRAATTDPQVQGAGFIFVVTNAPAALTPGLALTGFLQLPGEPANGVIVPNAAVVHSDGRAWIYVQTGDTTFARREISLDHPVAGGWFVTNGVAPGDKVVVTGAQTLLSEERKTEIKVGRLILVLNRIVQFSLRHRGVVIALGVLVIAYGLYVARARGWTCSRNSRRRRWSFRPKRRGSRPRKSSNWSPCRLKPA